MPAKPKALFFDVFGTLVDWRSGVAREARAVLAPKGFDLDWLAFADAWRDEYQPGMVHVKLMIVDGAFASVGSGNLDLRSLRLNDEANMNVLNHSFASEQARLFEQDKRRSREITLDDTGRMTFLNPIQQTASLVSPEL